MEGWQQSPFSLAAGKRKKWQGCVSCVAEICSGMKSKTIVLLVMQNVGSAATLEYDHVCFNYNGVLLYKEVFSYLRGKEGSICLSCYPNCRTLLAAGKGLRGLLMLLCDE